MLWFRLGIESKKTENERILGTTKEKDENYVSSENDNYKEANKLDNLICLCPVCHIWAETKRTK